MLVWQLVQSNKNGVLDMQGNVFIFVRYKKSQQRSIITSFLAVLKSGVLVILCQTIFQSHFIMSLPHLCFPLLFAKTFQMSLSLHSLIIPLRPNVFTFTAAEAADEYGDDDHPADHRDGNDESLEIHPAHSPSCI